jgi:hypothetical protein
MENPFFVRIPAFSVESEDLSLGQWRLSAGIGRLKTHCSDSCRFEKGAALHFLLYGLRFKRTCQSLHHP